jgi:hypothetical protein
LIDLAHSRAGTNEFAEGAVFTELSTEKSDLAPSLLPLDNLIEKDPQPMRVNGLGQIIVSAALECVYRGLNGTLRRQHHEGEAATLVMQRTKELEPAHTGHDKVADDD